MNRDGYQDILIEYYGMSGTGEKNGIEVHLYNPVRRRFEYSEQASGVRNPTFYFDRKILVGYYDPHGGIVAVKLRWHGRHLDTLELIDARRFVSTSSEYRMDVTVRDYATGRTRRFESGDYTLPEEYNLGQYQALKTPDWACSHTPQPPFGDERGSGGRGRTF